MTAVVPGPAAVLRPHPRVTEAQGVILTDGVALLKAAWPGPETCQDMAESAYRLAAFAYALRTLITEQVPAQQRTREAAAGTLGVTRAATRLMYVADMLPSPAVAAVASSATKHEIADLIIDVEAAYRKHPYRLFAPWAAEATRLALVLTESIGSAVHHQAVDQAAAALRSALEWSPVIVPDLSDGYLDRADMAALCHTQAETLWIWMIRYADFPAPDFAAPGRREQWHAVRAREVRAWWLRHGELPVFEGAAATVNPIGAQYLI